MVIDGDASVEEMAVRVQHVARSGIAVDVPGASWVWPKTLDGVQPGDERVIVAELRSAVPLALTLGGVPAVSRTALGIDSAGHLLYVSAPSQTAASLATILVHLGAVRAMELDINPEWPVAITYHKHGGHLPTMLFPNYQQSPGVFLSPGQKDFFAVYLRGPGTALGHVPW